MKTLIVAATLGAWMIGANVQGLSPEEIAHRCASTESSGAYGRLLVHRCLRAVREALAATVKGRTS